MALYVNGEPIESQRIEHEKERMRPSYEQTFADQAAEDRERQLSDWARENVIEAVLFRQSAIRECPTVPDADIDALLDNLLRQENETGPLHQRLSSGDAERQKVRQEAAGQIRSQRLLEKISAEVAEPKEKDIRRCYERNVERFTVPEMIRAAHIVKHPTAETPSEQQREAMEVVLAQLNSGADFATVAGEHSACPENGGDLGFFARGQMVPAFEEVVFNLKPGQVSGIFATEFGWHIAKVVDRRPALPCPLDQVRQLIVQELTKQARDKVLERFLDNEREKAVIEER
jgi:parvulin-like peptidyl-prolyl isomerase